MRSNTRVVRSRFPAEAVPLRRTNRTIGPPNLPQIQETVGVPVVRRAVRRGTFRTLLPSYRTTLFPIGGTWYDRWRNSAERLPREMRQRVPARGHWRSVTRSSLILSRMLHQK
jgi:hypothetical protein